MLSINYGIKKISIIFSTLFFALFLLSCSKENVQNSLSGERNDIILTVGDSNGFVEIYKKLAITITSKNEKSPTSVSIDYGNGTIVPLKGIDASYTYMRAGYYTITVIAKYQEETVIQRKKIMVSDNKPIGKMDFYTNGLKLTINYEVADVNDDIVEIKIDGGFGTSPKTLTDLKGTIEFNYNYDRIEEIELQIRDKAGNYTEIIQKVNLTANVVNIGTYGPEFPTITQGITYKYAPYTYGNMNAYIKYIPKNSIETMTFKSSNKTNTIVSLLDAEKKVVLHKTEIIQDCEAEISYKVTPYQVYYIRLESESPYNGGAKIIEYCINEREVQLLGDGATLEVFEKKEKIFKSEFYKFETKNKSLKLNFDNKLLDSSYKLRLIRDNIVKEIQAYYGDDIETDVGVIPNTVYYLEVYNENGVDGHYSLTINSKDELREIENNDSPQTANLISDKSIYKGFEVGGSDWFRFVAKDKCLNLSFRNLDLYNPNANYKLRLISTDQTSIMNETDFINSSDGEIVTGLTPGKMYYLQIYTEANNGGNYELQIDFTNEIWEVEKNDTPIAANLLEAEKLYRGFQIGGADYFKFIAKENQVNINFENLQKNDLKAEFKIRLKNYDGSTIMTEKLSTSINDIINFSSGVVPGKCYYIEILTDSNKGGKYVLGYR